MDAWISLGRGSKKDLLVNCGVGEIEKYKLEGAGWVGKVWEAGWR